MMSAEDDLGSSRTQILKTSPSRGFFKSKPDLADINLIIYTLVTLANIIILSKSDILLVWTLSYLFVNAAVITAVIIINYFPYQVLIDDRERDSAGFLISKPASVIVRQGPRLILKQPENLDDSSMIESAFSEHKQHLKNQAMSNKSLSFGIDQPSMRSAYRASIGLTLFTLVSISINIGLRVLSEIDPSFKNSFIIYGLIIVLIVIGFFPTYFYLIKNNRETIYRKNLFYKVLFFPHVQLGLIFSTIYVFINLSLYASVYFLAELLILTVSLAITNRIIYGRRVKKMSPKVDKWEKAVGEPVEMNVFTIDSTYIGGNEGGESDDDVDQDLDNVFEVKINKFESLSDNKTSSSLRKIGSETSNINLLV